MGESTPPPSSGRAPQDEILRLNKIIKSLMNRAEKEMGAGGSDFGLLQATVLLESQVKERTQALETALRENERITSDLLHKEEEQRKLIRKLEDARIQLLQSEKLASIGQLAAGVAHEINNPIGFVNSNLGTLQGYVTQFLALIDAYADLAASLPPETETVKRVEAVRRDIGFDYLREDVPMLIAESIDGTARVKRIVQDLRDFSRVGDNEWQEVDLHAGLDSTLNLLWNEIRFKAEVKKEYGSLPLVRCVPSQINQVFMNLLINAAQAIPEHGTITLRSGSENGMAWISVTDTGSGISKENLPRIFDPFFTTKPIGQGTGLGLSVAYGIIQTHKGLLEVDSQLGLGTTFTIRIPTRRNDPGEEAAKDGANEDSGTGRRH